ncbi:uncharacterized protein LOC135702982 [Ochlerotatus camptorhynchus]|uniref:uncharacterized protein LOC135702982 n=1 Tax=Ochlerotatus camptorhynchus TaxID=644619 RepID=UPI0031DEC4EB
MGPRLVILSEAAKRNCPSPTPSTSGSGPLKEKNVDENRVPTEPLVEQRTIRQILESNSKFRKILFSKLDAGIVPPHNGLLLMVRTLCEGMFAGQQYPTTDQKLALAIKIIDAFPVLKKTKLSEVSPDYSFFFWKNGGKGPGHEHSGVIQTHTRNVCKNVSPSKKKFTRKPKNKQVINVSSEIVEMAQEMAQIEATSSSFNNIARSMAETHDLLIMMLDAKSKTFEILNVFPHFRSYNGMIIQKAYERLMPSYNKESNLKQVFARGLLVNRGTFSTFLDDNVRGCLRILVSLTRRGVRKSSLEESTDIEAELAAPIIRCITDAETALQEQLMKYVAWNVDANVDVAPHLIFNGNNYFIYVDAQLIHGGIDSIRALDTLFKVFTVFNIRPPAEVQKIIDFIEIICYGIKTTSTRQMVNRLVSSFKESIHADEKDADE